MKFLYITTIGATMTFFKELIRGLLDQGHAVDIMCNESDFLVPDCYREWGCAVYQHDCARFPLSPGNLKAVSQISELVRKNQYDIVHCHTPVAAMCTRIACIEVRKRGTKVFYTAHGFHFFKGAPLQNWRLYYPVEKICSYFTDVLITINQEDYHLAQRKMKAGRVEYIPGVGVDVEKFRNTQVDRKQKRAELGIPADATLLLSVGELNRNKNQQVIIRALVKLNDSSIHYAVVGIGNQMDALKSLAEELGVAKQVHFLGFRNDVAELCHTADMFCFPSQREGLGLAAVEAMAAGLPVIAADNRGTREYMVNGKTGFVCKHDDVVAFANAIYRLQQNVRLKQEIGVANKKRVESFDINNVISLMERIYGTDSREGTN